MSHPGLAQTPDGAASEGKSVAIVRVDSAPVIDGVLDDAIWALVMPIEDLHQVNPVEYNEPSERTEIRIAYDDDALYISARLWDSQADLITAQILRQGEAISDDDNFAIILDPHLDRRSGYRFQVNPNGVRFDALYSDTNNTENDWEGIWLAESTVDDQGWTAEIAIPFKTLSFDPDGEAWGMNFSRAIQHLNESVAWVSRNRQANPGVAGTVIGFRDLQQGRGLDIVPSVSAQGQRIYGPTMSSSSDAEPSLDIFYKLTPSLNGALTLNTDFSSTEIDDRQVNLTRFSLFFPEKRDFFLQDADIFEFGRIGGGGGNRNFRGGGGGGGGGGQNGMPFFSRRLGISPSGQPVDIDVGAKLSGRVGRLNLGVLSVRQGSFIDGTEMIEADDIFIGRVSANVLGESNVGVIFTDGDPQSNINSSTIGTDFNYRNTRLPGNKVIEANAWYQTVDEQDIDDKNNAYGFGISSPNNTGWRGGISGRVIEENFDPAVGFVNETGIRSYSANMRYGIRPVDKFIRTINPQIQASRTERIDTGLLDRASVQARVQIQTRTQDNIFINISENKENIPFDFPIYRPSNDPGDESTYIFIDAGSYTWTSASVGLSSGSQRKISAFVSFTTGDYYNGKSDNINANVQFRPSSRLSFTTGYGMRDVELPGGNFQVRQGDFTAQFVFSATLSWINKVQYDNFSEVVGFNSRLHWIPEAGREGFIVFNHSVADPEKNDSFHSTNADLSVKFSYTLRF